MDIKADFAFLKVIYLKLRDPTLVSLRFILQLTKNAQLRRLTMICSDYIVIYYTLPTLADIMDEKDNINEHKITVFNTEFLFKTKYFSLSLIGNRSENSIFCAQRIILQTMEIKG